MNPLIKKLLTATLSSIMVVSAAFSSLAVTAASADTTKTLSQTFAYTGQEVLLDMDIGSAKFIATDEQEIRIEVLVTPSESNWFSLWGSADVEDIELDVVESSSEIELKVTEQDDVKQEWVVYLPRQAALNLNVGIGQIEVSNMENNIDIDLGVGHAEINHEILYRSVSLESGVGEVEVNLQGQSVEVSRSFVMQSYHNEEQTGFGQLNVNVGVGQIDVHHKL
ncbi:hypothetical protein FM038_018655 [Shewanella eurypsychrophilus]|uniref:Adhesin domain-containing protein n=1 Tax=Shewanella eurypsychrophilus TaxID=2593656 RepID=A0ABX6VBC5_9GAMM|nr:MULTISPECIES: hypothetical protein [Shewanella]QFU23982.1 hypothetical protein FS418_20415 [Shewanella sp. YLB-09]QPG59197.1 hypothetical protein FM038_018655 [Shewanella eurypsychrophilus]